METYESEPEDYELRQTEIVARDGFVSCDLCGVNTRSWTTGLRAIYYATDHPVCFSCVVRDFNAIIRKLRDSQ